MRILKKIILLILILIVFYNMIYVLETSFGRKEFRLFNLSVFIVTDKSMKPELNHNDVIITKICKASDLAVGDIIVFDLNDYTTISRIAIIDSNKYVTKGDNNYYFYKDEISIDQIKGKMINKLPQMGVFFYIIQSKITTGIIIIYLILYYIRVWNLKKKSARRKKQKEMSV